jgi:hypothetical protein
MPGIHFLGAGGLQGTFTQIAQPNSVFWLGDMPGDSATNMAMFDSNDSSNRQFDQYNGFNQGQIQVFAGSGPVAGSNTVNMSTAPHSINTDFNGSSTVNQIDNGSASSTMAVGAQGLHGISIGIHNGGTLLPLTGNVGWVLVASTIPSSGDKTIIHGIDQAIWGLA